MVDQTLMGQLCEVIPSLAPLQVGKERLQVFLLTADRLARNILLRALSLHGFQLANTGTTLRAVHGAR